MGNGSARKPACVVIGLKDERPKALLALHSAVLRTLRLAENSVVIWTVAGVWVYDWRRLVLLRTLHRSQTTLTCTDLCQHSTVLGSSSGLLTLLDLTSGHTLWEEMLEAPAIQVLLRTERLYAGFASGEVHVWDTRTGHNLLRINRLQVEHLTPVRALTHTARLELLFSAHSSHYTDQEGHLVTSPAALVRGYEVQKGGKIQRYEGLTGSSVSAEVDEELEVLLVLSGPVPCVHIWAIANPCLLLRIQQNCSPAAFSLALSTSNGHYHLATSDGVVMVAALTGEHSALHWTNYLTVQVNCGSNSAVSWLVLDEASHSVTLGTAQGVVFLSTNLVL